MAIEMSDLLKLILSLSLSGTLLIFILLLLRPLYRERLSKRWQYYIWLIVIARLLLPITPETSLMGNFFYQMEHFGLPGAGTQPAQKQNLSNSDIIGDFLTSAENTGKDENSRNSANTARVTGMADAASDGNVFNPDMPDVIQDDVNPNDAKAASDANNPSSNNKNVSRIGNNFPENTAAKVLTAWLVIALLLLMRKITVYQSFVKYVSAGSKPVDDIILLERFGQIMAQNHITGAVDLCCNSLVSSPLLIGFVHPRIILPDINLSENDFYYTILHELTHYKRRDMPYKWLLQLTVCLHWFNPFVYLMGYEVNRLCELSCDERVISLLPENTRKFYGDTLLNAIGTGGSYKDTLASVTLNESKELLKGRLEAIMKYRKIPKTIQAAGIFITGILIGGATVLGAYAMPGSKISSADNSTSNVEKSADDHSDAASQSADYDIQYEDGIYYIYTGGATEADRPLSTITNGYKELVLVRKDSYTAFASFTDYDMLSLVSHVSEQCRTMLANGQIMQEDVDIIKSAATEIQEIYRSRNETSPIRRNYSYTQAAYYQHPYIIEFGYNLDASSRSDYSAASITLSDNRSMPVYFSGESKRFISDENVISAVTTLLKRMIPQKADTAHPIEVPFIVSIEYVGDTDVNSLSEKYYGEELTYFGAVFLELDSQLQQEYLDRMFEDRNISFFACCIGYLEEANALQNTVDYYILRAYEENAVNFFAVLAGMLDDESRKQWMEKCWREYNTAYYYILSEDEDDFDGSDFGDADYN